MEGGFLLRLNKGLKYLMLLYHQKEAEIHLPELDARDGITIPMEDIGTSQVWNMRYRYLTL